MTADSSPAAGPVLIAERLTKTYAGPAGPVAVLRDLNLTLAAGEAVAVTGPSGSGKSSLLHVLGALDRATDGVYTLAGRCPATLDDAELSRFRNRTIGFVFQDHHLLPQCSVLENVLIPTLPAVGADAAAEARARELLIAVGLGDRLDHRPAQLSGGERQRVAVARALVNKPTLLLCDEPTGNLDRKSAGVVADLLLDLNRREKTLLVVVTHSVELAGRFPRRVELVDGALVDVGASA
ncbi:MAG: ABC transporter ATP-binding protein [Planctomycetia bacterium]